MKLQKATSLSYHIAAIPITFLAILAVPVYAHSVDNNDHNSSGEGEKTITVMSYGELAIVVVPFTAALIGGIIFLFKGQK